jgi:hypothetical protein
MRASGVRAASTETSSEKSTIPSKTARRPSSAAQALAGLSPSRITIWPLPS